MHPVIVLTHHFMRWLAATPFSQVIQNTSWIIPLIQTIHILSIAIVLSSVAMIDLRLMGWAADRNSVSYIARRYVPWIWCALAVLLVTGLLLITAEPARALTNPAFWVKMSLLVIAVAITIVFQVSVSRHARFWDLAPAHAPIARAMGGATLLLWFAIAVAGRWIAYLIGPPS